MSFGDPQFEGAYARDRIARLTAEAEAINAARQAGHKPLIIRLFDRLRRRGTAAQPDQTLRPPG